MKPKYHSTKRLFPTSSESKSKLGPGDDADLVVVDSQEEGIFE